MCTVQWNNAQIPDCVWPLAACFVKQWEAWPWWQPQDNSRPPWPLVSTRESHFMLFKTASETRVSFRVQSRYEFQVWFQLCDSDQIGSLKCFLISHKNCQGSHQTIIANCLFSNQFFWFKNLLNYSTNNFCLKKVILENKFYHSTFLDYSNLRSTLFSKTVSSFC